MVISDLDNQKAKTQWHELMHKTTQDGLDFTQG